MNVILHIGTHKTGTTSIQKYCHQRRAQLALRGVLYPGYDLIDSPGHYAHLDIAHSLAGITTPRTDPTTVVEWVKRVRDLSADYDSVLISAEPFYRHVLPQGASKEDYWEGRRRYVERVREVFDGDDVRIVCIVRRQDHFAQSMYNENLKVTRYPRKLANFLRERKNTFDYKSQLGIWKDNFEQTEVFTFEDLVASERELPVEFMARLGLPIVPDVYRVVRQNASLPLPLLEYKRLLNRTSLTDKHLSEILHYMEKKGFFELAGLDDTKYTWAPPETFQKFLDQFEEGNEWIRSHLTNLERDFLFAPGPPPTGEVFKGLDKNTHANISAALLENTLDGMAPPAPPPKSDKYVALAESFAWSAVQAWAATSRKFRRKG